MYLKTCCALALCLAACNNSPSITPAGSVVATPISDAVKLSFVKPPATVNALECQPIVIEAESNDGTPATVGVMQTVNLKSTSDTGDFYSDADCNRIKSTVSIPLGSSSATFYYQDVDAGSPTISASNDGPAGLQAATVKITIEQGSYSDPEETYQQAPSDPTQLAFSYFGSETVAACEYVTVDVLDDALYPAEFKGHLVVSVSTSSSTGGFYRDEECKVPVTTVEIEDADPSAVLYFKDSKTGKQTFSAALKSKTGDTITNLSLKPASYDIELSPEVPETALVR